MSKLQKRLKKIIEHYEKHHSGKAQAELDMFNKNNCSFDDAIKMAALAVNQDGKRFSHQQLILKGALPKSKAELKKKKRKLKKISTFKELHEYVKNTIGDIKGIGKLTIYDTALRIGAHFDLMPELIYLHAGTREGAKKLLQRRLPQTLAKCELPEPLRNCDLEPFQIEDVLCIYKDYFDSNSPLPKARCGDSGICGSGCR